MGGQNILDQKSLVDDFLSKKEDVQLHVLSFGMQNMVVTEGDNALIITIQ